MLDLLHTLQDLQAWGVSLVAQTGLQFDLRIAQGKLINGVQMGQSAALYFRVSTADQICARQEVLASLSAIYCANESVRGSRLLASVASCQRLKADRYASKVLKLVGEGQSYREISHRLGLSKNTVLDIVKRDRAT
jgi:putative DNA-invertase from lambdoid prophage Rac